MLNFYEWLKKNKELPYEESKIKETKSMILFGSPENPSYFEYQPITLSKQETKMLFKMWQYVMSYPEVTDQMLLKMLENNNLKKFKNLIEEYSPCDGGIASDLRSHGYSSVAYYIVYKRNLNSDFKKAMERPLPNKKNFLNKKSTRKLKINNKIEQKYSSMEDINYFDQKD